jgi:enoyl-CoA hydratase
MTEGSAEVVVVVADGRVGRITLNRPSALNALTLEMVRLFDRALTRFQLDRNISTIVIDGAGDRALCAGGDIRSIYDSALLGDPTPLTFWAEEYQLNYRIANYPKPIVAIMDGIVMGGGVGISAHASHRVVTEHSVLAMPEVGIGFAPDVGSTWLLSRSRGEYGTHLALTGERIGAGDAIVAGLADKYVPRASLPSLMKYLATRGVDDALSLVVSAQPEARLAASQGWIDQCYSSDDVEEIVLQLRACGGDAGLAASDILTKSPTALKVALRELRDARHSSNLADCLETEHRASTKFLATPDFIEGVRAAIVDKDRAPQWNPSLLEDVKDIAQYFAKNDDGFRIDRNEVGS